MDLLTLDSNNKPKKLVENYDSLIWTERFNTIGDFQITTGDVGFVNLLPEGTLLTLAESNHVMQVERHLIERKKNRPTLLTIKGRSWDTILQRRVAISSVSAGVAEWSVVVKTPSDAAYFIIVKICVEGILDPLDIFPPEIVQFPTPDDYLTSTGPNRQFSIQKGNLLSAVLTLLQTQAKADPTTIPPTPEVVPHGIRAVRPASDAGPIDSAIAIEIYKGVDRSDEILFDGSRELLDDGSYLFSKEGSANVAYILGPAHAAKMSKPIISPSSLDRRVILVDGTTSGITDLNALKSQGEISLAQAPETALFDGSINQDLSPYLYGRDYNLGDIVRLAGDYGLDRKARVTEYIRTQDATGSKSYPTLTTLDE